MPSKFKVSENTNVQLPLRNLISIIGAVAVGVWAYFGIIERLNIIETNSNLILIYSFLALYHENTSKIRQKMLRYEVLENFLKKYWKF